MTRLLPWLTNSKVQKAESSSPSPAKKRPVVRSLSSDSDHVPVPVRSELKARNREPVSRRIAHAPSSSPPPPLPLVEVQLRPGLENDDIWIMVEDEFLATAQTFTRHLHHAEYKRLKEQTKKLDATISSHTSRPTDGKTAMPETLRRQKLSAQHQARLERGLEKTIPGPEAGKVNDEDRKSGSAGENEDEHEPWQGTHLQHFMTKSPRKEPKSLTGLHRFSSSTRAAAGLQRAEKSSPSRARPRPSAGDQHAGRVEIDLEDDDTDDLDAPARVSELEKQAVTQSSSSMAHPGLRHRELACPPTIKTERIPQKRAFLDVSPVRSTQSFGDTAMPGSLPERQQSTYDSETGLRGTQASRTAIQKRLRIEREQTDQKKNDVIPISDEIPIFLA